MREGALADLLVQHGGHVGFDETRGDDIGGDAAAGDFAGDAFCHSDEAGLAGGVVRLAGEAHEAADRADVDDAAGALLDHGAEDGAGEIEGALEVRLEHGVPIAARHAHREGVAGDAGVVHEDVAAAEVGEDLVAGFLHRIEVGHIDRVGFRRTRGGGVDIGCDFCGVCLRAADDGDFGAFGGEGFCDGFADAAAGARDDGDLVFESFVAHVWKGFNSARRCAARGRRGV